MVGKLLVRGSAARDGDAFSPCSDDDFSSEEEDRSPGAESDQSEGVPKERGLSWVADSPDQLGGLLNDLTNLRVSGDSDSGSGSGSGSATEKSAWNLGEQPQHFAFVNRGLTVYGNGCRLLCSASGQGGSGSGARPRTQRRGGHHAERMVPLPQTTDGRDFRSHQCRSFRQRAPVNDGNRVVPPSADNGWALDQLADAIWTPHPYF